jgi:hypothetical protein
MTLRNLTIWASAQLLKAMPKAKPSGSNQHEKKEDTSTDTTHPKPLDPKSAEYQASRETTLEPQPDTLHEPGTSRGVTPSHESSASKLADLGIVQYRKVEASVETPPKIVSAPGSSARMKNLPALLRRCTA